MKGRIYISVLFVTTAFMLYGQDMQFTQFYASPLYLNPANAGANTCSRVSTNYRQQWPAISNGYSSYLISFDHELPRLNSGIGAMFSTDKAGTGKLRTTDISLFYAYGFTINRKWAGRVGFQGGYTTRSINFFDLTFGDQLARGGASTTVEAPIMKPVSYLDLSAGGLLFGEKYWIGYAAHHLNQPNQSLTGIQSNVPIKHSVHGGARFIIGEQKDEAQEPKMTLSPVFNYKAQEKFDQLDLGIYYTYTPITLGLWYRGIPFLKAYQPGYANNDAIALVAGYKLATLRFGYSYDFTISRLFGSTNGSHEISLSYQFCDPEQNKKKRKKRRSVVIPCPKF